MFSSYREPGFSWRELDVGTTYEQIVMASMFHIILGLYSQGGQASYRKISRTLEAAGFGFNFS